MQEIGDKAIKVLEFINERFEVTNDDLFSAFPDNPMFEVVLLQELRLILFSTSSNDSYDYQISPMGRDYLEHHSANLKQMEQTSKYQQNMEAGLQESNARADLLNTQVDMLNTRADRITKQMEAGDAANAKSSRIATILSIIGIIIAFASLLVALFK